MLPGAAVVGDAVTAGEGGVVGHLPPAVELALLGVNGVGVGLALMQVTDALPCGAIHAYAFESAGAGEDDAPATVVPGVLLVRLKHWELYVVHGFQIVEAQPEGHRAQHVYLHQGLAALEVVAQWDVPCPLSGECFERLQAAVLNAPCLLPVVVAPHLFPQLGVGTGQAVEEEGAEVEGLLEMFLDS